MNHKDTENKKIIRKNIFKIFCVTAEMIRVACIKYPTSLCLRICVVDELFVLSKTYSIFFLNKC